MLKALNFMAFFPAFKCKVLLRQVTKSNKKGSGKNPGNCWIKTHVFHHHFQDRIIQYEVDGND